MAEVLLQSVANIRTGLGYETSTDVDAALTSALERATAELRGLLRSDFTRGVATDTFMVRNITIGSGAQAVGKLKLSRGFVDEGETISMIASETLKGLDTADSYVNLRANVDNENFDHMLMEDAERGRILIGDFSFLGRQTNYVRVSYTCGYTTGGNPAVYKSIPEWLVSLAEIKAELASFMNPSLNPGLDVGASKVQGEPARVSELRRTFETILADHVCYGPGYAKAWKRAFTAS